jgi:mono/diheme cytochrome c family protein
VAALEDELAKVRAHSIRVAEPLLGKAQGASLLSDVMRLAGDDATEVRMQFILTITGLASDAGDAAVAAILRDHGDDHRLREAAVSGLAKREVQFLRRLIEDSSWAEQSAARGDVITDVARSVTRRYDGPSVTALAHLIGDIPKGRDWQQLALLEAIPAFKPGAYDAPKPIDVPEEPAVVALLTSSPNEALRKRASKVSNLFHWPGKPIPPRPKAAPFTLRQKELFEVGKKQYALICAQCHQPSGMGQEGKAPPLVNSPWALGPERRLIRIVLHGMRGPVTLGGRTFNMDMPALSALTDEQIAGVLTYVRREWGHEAAAVDPATVKEIRDWTQARRDGWTEKELLEMK